MGRTPLPFRAIAAYSDWAGQTCPVEKSRFVQVMIAMDNLDRKITKPKAGA
jgi:hypothetical protein